MTGSTDRARLGPQARALYARGSSVDEIAEALSVHPSTLYRWRRADADAGLDWDVRRDQRERQDPHAVLAVLERVYGEIVTDEEHQGDAAWVDRVTKLDQVIDRARKRLGDVSTVLGVLEDFAVWTGDNLAEGELEAVRSAVAAYLDYLRRSNR